MDIDLFGTKKKKLLEEAKRANDLLEHIKRKKPMLKNETSRSKVFDGIGTCQLCKKRISFAILLDPGESSYIFCKDCEVEIKNAKDTLKKAEELTKKDSSAKKLTLNLTNKNNKGKK